MVQQHSGLQTVLKKMILQSLEIEVALVISYRKAKLEAEKILKSKQTIGEQLEACRPTLTADKRRTSALITPTLYHYVSLITPTLYPYVSG